MFSHPGTALYANSSHANPSLCNNFLFVKMRTTTNPQLLFLYFSMDRVDSSGFVLMPRAAVFGEKAGEREWWSHVAGAT